MSWLRRFNPLLGAAPAPPRSKASPSPLDSDAGNSAEDVSSMKDDGNAEATKTAIRRSPRKRKMSEDEREPTSPTKRRSVGQPAREHPAPVESETYGPPASRLRTRKSTAQRHSISRNDVFAVPLEESEEPVRQAEKAQMPGPRRMRLLGGRPPNPSPLKQHGVIEMPSVGVDLLGSPEKRKKKPTNAIRESQDKEISPIENVKPSDSTGVSRRTKGPSKKSGAADQKSKAAGIATTNPPPKARVRIVRTQSELAAQPSEDGLDSSDDNDDDSEVSGVSHDAAVQPQEPENDSRNVKSNTAMNGDRPPEQTAEAQAQAQAQARADEEAARIIQEEEEKRMERTAKLMNGFENLANLHHCEEYWVEMFLSAQDTLEKRSSFEAESVKGKKLVKRIGHLTAEYKRLSAQINAGGEEDDISLARPIDHLQSRIETFKEEETGDKSREMTRKARDVHQLVVPKLIFLLRAALWARASDDGLSLSGYQEICSLLTIAVDAAEVAVDWEPRPSGIDGIRHLVHKIRLNLNRVAAKYSKELQRLEWPIAEARKLDKLEARQRQDLEELWDFQRRQELKLLKLEQDRKDRQAEAMREKEQERASYQTLSRERHGKAEVYDIDDLDSSEDPFLGPSTAALPNRPRLLREQTEEIPGPVQGKWSDPEQQVLINGLQRFQGQHRFQDILDQYADRFNGRNLDDIIAQAKFIKESMASRLGTERFGPEWDWLRSVPS